MSKHDIETAYGLIEALGGAHACAEDLGVSPASVEKWAISGFIPNGWHLRLFGKVAAMRKTVSPTVFGFDDEYTHDRG